MKVAAIIQARMTSTRLPGKVLKKVNGKTLLEYQLERVKRSKLIDEIIVATTTNKSDDPIVSLCNQLSVSVYRGSEDDVLSRYYEAAIQYDADVVVRLTSDCPLIDPQVIDFVIQTYMDNCEVVSYVSNCFERTYPRGLDTEVFSFQALQQAYQEAILQRDREHVTIYLYTNPEKFRLMTVRNKSDESQYRWTVDTIEDFELIKNILEAIYPVNSQFTWKGILGLLNENPEWNEINAMIEQKEV
ncbi:cytidylyltransferase domain-containing protein [Metabacillus fastidiosus]|uniref:cytidylyltransferase domain-containing protein n=1 Tax=Metabacillus fastidiosus TaxID=1458 RepID=UPI003D2A0BAF